MFGSVLLIANFMMGQKLPANQPETTRLEIVCDRTGISLYLDNVLLGKSPLPNPVDVQPGWHAVSFFPAPEEKPAVLVEKDLYRVGMQQVLIEPGETARVVMSYSALAGEIKEEKHEYDTSRWIGMLVLLGTLTIVVWGFG